MSEFKLSAMLSVTLAMLLLVGLLTYGVLRDDTAIADDSAIERDMLATGDHYTVNSSMIGMPPFVISTDDDITYKGITEDRTQLMFRDDRRKTILVDARVGATFSAYGTKLRVKQYDANTRTVRVGRP